MLQITLTLASARCPRGVSSGIKFNRAACDSTQPSRGRGMTGCFILLRSRDSALANAPLLLVF